MTYKELVDSGKADDKLKTELNEARFWTGTTGDNWGPDNLVSTKMHKCI